MSKVTVDLGSPSLYAEPTSLRYRLVRRISYRPVWKHVRPLLRNDKEFSLLEVGTGSGYFLEMIERTIPAAKVFGIEYDPRLVQITTDKVKRAVVYQGDAESLAFSHRFDVIVSFQVIEHLYQPERLIRGAKAHLKRGGYLVFSTPNLDCLAARVMGQRWHGYRKDHVSLKSRAAWSRMARSEGFREIYSGSTFFSGLPGMRNSPFAAVNVALLLLFGTLRWNLGESFVGVYELE